MNLAQDQPRWIQHDQGRASLVKQWQQSRQDCRGEAEAMELGGQIVGMLAAARAV